MTGRSRHVRVIIRRSWREFEKQRLWQRVKRFWVTHPNYVRARNVVMDFILRNSPYDPTKEELQEKIKREQAERSKRRETEEPPTFGELWRMFVEVNKENWQKLKEWAGRANTPEMKFYEEVYVPWERRERRRFWRNFFRLPLSDHLRNIREGYRDWKKDNKTDTDIVLHHREMKEQYYKLLEQLADGDVDPKKYAWYLDDRRWRWLDEYRDLKREPTMMDRVKEKADELKEQMKVPDEVQASMKRLRAKADEEVERIRARLDRDLTPEETEQLRAQLMDDFKAKQTMFKEFAESRMELLKDTLKQFVLGFKEGRQTDGEVMRKELQNQWQEIQSMGRAAMFDQEKMNEAKEKTFNAMTSALEQTVGLKDEDRARIQQQVAEVMERVEKAQDSDEVRAARAKAEALLGKLKTNASAAVEELDRRRVEADIEAGRDPADSPFAKAQSMVGRANVMMGGMMEEASRVKQQAAEKLEARREAMKTEGEREEEDEEEKRRKGADAAEQSKARATWLLNSMRSGMVSAIDQYDKAAKGGGESKQESKESSDESGVPSGGAHDPSGPSSPRGSSGRGPSKA